MFYIFSENVIKITKANTAAVEITLVNSETGECIRLSGSDKVLFTVKTRNGTTVIQKVLTNDNLISDIEEDPVYDCVFDPEDTINLPTGEYDYDCLLLTSDGQAVTFISSTLVIKKAIGLYTDVKSSGGDGA